MDVVPTEILHTLSGNRGISMDVPEILIGFAFREFSYE